MELMSTSVDTNVVGRRFVIGNGVAFADVLAYPCYLEAEGTAPTVSDFPSRV